MTMPIQWRRGPRPDPSVLAVTGALDEAAKAGSIRNLAVVSVNPMLEVEFAHAGELDEVRKTLLIGGLTRLIKKLSE